MRIRKLFWLATAILCMSSLPVAPRPASAQSDGLLWLNVAGLTQPRSKVGGVMGSVEPWSTTGGRAYVNLVDGRVLFNVKGLALAGGDAIGTTPVAQIKGTLVCDPNADAGGPVLVDTPSLGLSLEGDAAFTGTVALDFVCLNYPGDIAFPIRTATPPPDPVCVPRQGSDCWLAHGAALRR